jgi:hypothetical protein
LAFVQLPDGSFFIFRRMRRRGGQTMSLIGLWILRILGLLIAAAGLIVVYGAPSIVDRKGLAAKKKFDPKYEENLPPEELEKHHRNAAILDVKLYGLLISAPGFILTLIAFR